ncbi:MAG: molybdopterin-dependent oxidoreductase [Melioribacteraceae bacterium]|nr:molybdopterin-dependent oxidoreductase [Melioribacteraceae bacterium]
MNKKLNTSRRSFLGKGALLGGGALATIFGNEKISAQTQQAIIKSNRPDADYTSNKPENFIYSVCLNCNTGCGIKAKNQDGILAKIDGNPYNPWTMVPHLSMKTDVDEAARIDGGLCPKGQAGVQIAYDPYRIRKVLKRAGKRGENKWKAIPFEQAISEIVEGGKLFADVPGEENRNVEGLKDIMVLKDANAAKEMSKDIEAIWNEKGSEKKKALVADFKEKHKENLDKLIDPEHPDLGPKNNQFVMAYGRLKNGRKDFFKRFQSAFGTTNLHGHTTVCQGSLYFTCKAISEQYQGGKFQGGSKFYWQADLEHAKYVLFVGANLFEANYGPTNRTVRLTENLAKGYTKIAVADPRFSKLASKAHKWLPLKPGTDAPLALAMIQWIINNKRYDEKFLRNANKAAAKAANETSWTTAPYLVEIKDGEPGKLIRAADFGLKTSEKRKFNGSQYDEKFLVVMVNGKPTWVDPNDEKNHVYGDLLVDTELTNKEGEKVKVKSGLQILKESSEEHSITEWCEIAGVNEKDVIEVAKELTSYGKQAAVDIHRGPAQHTNGFYNVLSWMSLNMLIGNYDWAGGMSKATTYKYDGSEGGVFDLKKQDEKISGFGISSIRHGINYEKTTLFEGYPAKRNWFPLSSDIYEEIIPSIADEYPYPVKALFFYMGAPTYALPAGHTNIEILADVNKLPLFFTSDIIIGSTSMYSDYIFPDLSYLERWEFQGSHPNMPAKVENVRQPVISPIPEKVKVYGEEIPCSLESMFMALNEKLGLKAFGKNALGEGLDITKPDDLYLRAIANLAHTESGVPEADDRELEVFSKARRHLDKSVFDEQRWKEIVGEDKWRKVVYILNRGGRYEDHDKSFEGDKLAHRFGALLNLYQEKTATKKYAATGKPYYGFAKYLPIMNYAQETVEKLSDGYEFSMITNRTITQTKSRTIGAYWLQPIMPENGIMINPRDAKKLGVEKDDLVRVTSATNTKGIWDFKNGKTKDIIGKVIPTETMRPGVISFVLGFGHWATGSEDVNIDGETIEGDPRRAKGVHANAAMWTDSSLRNNTCMIDPVGGSVSFYDTKVKLEKV